MRFRYFLMALALFAFPGMGHAQTRNMVITGFGTVEYIEGEFGIGFSPIILYSIDDQILFEAEFEFGFEDGQTTTVLEYAQIDLAVTDNLVLSAGKMMLPFGTFGPRRHPSWINRFASMPPLFGHHGSSFGAAPLVPILTDIGIAARLSTRPGRFKVNFSAFVTNGPAEAAHGEEMEEHGEEMEEHGEEMEEMPDLMFAVGSDNNDSKMIGGRVDVSFGSVAFNVSYLTGAYDADDMYSFTGMNAGAEYRLGSLALRGEYIRTVQESEHEDAVRDGLYGQASYRTGSMEPVLRYTTVNGEATQIGIGINHWLNASTAIKVGYEFNRETDHALGNDRMLVQFALGF